MKPNLRYLSLACAVILLAFALRMYRLDYFSLRGDESFTVLFVQKPLAQLWTEIRTVEPNPPLLYFLLRGWITLAGAGEFATRYFAVFWGVLCVALIYRLARDLFPPAAERGGRVGVGAAAAFLFAINPYQIWHSQDVRNYTLWPALSLLALVFFWQWLDRARRPSPSATASLAFFILAELAALYTHYYEAFILLALNFYVFIFFWRARALILQWLGAQAVLALLYLPYPLFISDRAAAYGEGSGQQGVALWAIWQRTFSAFTLGETLDADWRNVLWLPLALALGAILVALWRDRRPRAVFFSLYAGVPTLAVFALNLARPLFLERYLNGSAPAYYLLLAYGVTTCSWRKSWTRFRWHESWTLVCALAVFSLLALLALTNYFFNPAYAKAPDWRALAHAINTQRQDGDIILQNFPETSLLYYERSRLPLVVYPQNFVPDQDTPRALNAINSNYQRIWFIPAAPDFWDPEQFVVKWLDVHDDLQNAAQYGTLQLRLYATPSRFLNTMTSLRWRVGNSALLVGYRLEQQAPTLRVVLYWRALERLKKDYTVFAHLVAADGRLLAQQDRAPVHGAYPTNQWTKNELVVDQYELSFNADARALAIGMYDPQTVTRLPVTDADNQPRGDTITLPLAP